MGTQGSKYSAPEGQEQVPDYYALLEVSEEATQDEIRVRKPRMHISWTSVGLLYNRFRNPSGGSLCYTIQTRSASSVLES